MKLSTRLFGIAALLTAVSSASVGFVGVNTSYNSEISRIDDSINVVFGVTKDSTTDKLSAAIEGAAGLSISVSVALLDSQKQVTELAGEGNLLNVSPPAAALKTAEKRAVSVDAKTHYRLRSVSLASGDHVLIAADIKPVEDARSASIQRLAGFTTIAVLLSMVLIWLLVRRDIAVVEKLAKAAGEISRGESNVLLPKVKGDSEVAILSNSLGEMVGTLEGSIQKQREAQDAIETFIGDASHELRTPLTVIRGYSEMLASKGDDADFRGKALERIAVEVDRMNQLISDMLTIAELGESKQAEFEQVDLAARLRESIDDLALLSEGRQIASSVEASLEVPGDANLLRQLLNNLFSNIARHTPADAEVRVELARSGELVTLTIDDAGPGLAEAKYERGIDGFERFDPFAARAKGGSGLGMTIMRRIVAVHGGTIALSKSPLGGLRTTIQLPA